MTLLEGFSFPLEVLLVFGLLTIKYVDIIHNFTILSMQGNMCHVVNLKIMMSKLEERLKTKILLKNYSVF